MFHAVRFGLLAGLVAGSMVLASPAVLAQKLSSPTHQAFVLYEFEVHDPAGFKALAAKVRDSLKAFKGEFVMREKVSSIFGGTPSNLSVISFPSVEDARTWLASPELAALKAERDKVADVRTYLVEKLE
jgi:uncharacterized protein (DUF1330 family)